MRYLTYFSWDNYSKLRLFTNTRANQSECSRTTQLTSCRKNRVFSTKKLADGHETFTGDRFYPNAYDGSYFRFFNPCAMVSLKIKVWLPALIGTICPLTPTRCHYVASVKSRSLVSCAYSVNQTLLVYWKFTNSRDISDVTPCCRFYYMTGFLTLPIFIHAFYIQQCLKMYNWTP